MTEQNQEGAVNPEPVKEKRKYTKRKDEFKDMTVDQLKAELDVASRDLKALSALIKANPDDAEAKEQHKQSTNRRVYIYARLRQLGCSLRKEHQKAPEPSASPATEPAPITQTSPEGQS